MERMRQNLKLLVCGIVVVLLAGCAQQPPKPLSEKKYFKVRELYDQADRAYRQELSILQKLHHANDAIQQRTLEQQLKSEILIKNDRRNGEYDGSSFFQKLTMTNEYRLYPFTQAKDELDDLIGQLYHHRGSLFVTDTFFAQQVDSLVVELDALRCFVVASKDYQNERQAIEDRRIEEERARAQCAQAMALTDLAYEVAKNTVVAAQAPETTTVNYYDGCQVNDCRKIQVNNSCQVNNIR